MPFAAVAAANCVNIPLMRQNELIEGIVVQDENGNEVGKSRLAAAKGMSQVNFIFLINLFVKCEKFMLAICVIGGIFTYFYGCSWNAVVANYYGEIGTDSLV